MPVKDAKDLALTALEPEAVEPGEVREPGRFHVDLPQYVQTEVKLPATRALQPLRDEPVVPHGLVARARHAATSWRVKGIVQRVLGAVPGGHALHHQLQRRLGGLRDFTAECDTKVDDWLLMMEHLAAARIALPHACFVEMGTGWYPTFAVCLHLAGAQQVMTLDLRRLLDPALTIAMVDRLAVHLGTIAAAARRDVADVRADHIRVLAALRAGATIEAATQGAVIYRAPGDVAHLSLASGTVDVVFSNSVLEHVPPAALEPCFREAMRVLRPGGIVYHSVNCGDHYAYTDRTIHQLHYLQYSDEEWARWNNAFLYQNRLRAIDFLAICKRAGFRIELDTSRPHPGRLAHLAQMTVHPRFASYTREQLAVTSIDFIGRKPAADRPGN